MKAKKTELQKKFEAQTPTIMSVNAYEYLITYAAWLEVQIEKLHSLCVSISQCNRGEGLPVDVVFDLMELTEEYRYEKSE